MGGRVEMTAEELDTYIYDVSMGASVPSLRPRAPPAAKALKAASRKASTSTLGSLVSLLSSSSHASTSTVSTAATVIEGGPISAPLSPVTAGRGLSSPTSTAPSSQLNFSPVRKVVSLEPPSKLPTVNPHASAKSRRSVVSMSSVLSPERSVVEEQSDVEEDPTGDRWFVKHESTRRHRTTQLYHPYARDEVPYPIAYGHASSNWDELTTALGELNRGESTLPPPRKALDLGCSRSANWIIRAAMEWEESRFTGLDVVPITLLDTDVLPAAIATRLTFVQHNFLSKTGLPFESESFDYVRMSNLALGIPEPQWLDLVEDVNRILTPDGTLEIIENDTSVFRTRWKTPEGTTTSHAEVLVAIDDVLSRRFINAHPLSVIPPVLAMTCGHVDRSGATLELKTAVAGESDQSAQVVLHAYAERGVASSKLIAREESIRRLEAAEAPPSDAIRFRRQAEDDVEDLIDDWTDELKARAGIASLLGECWGWDCAMDVALEKSLATNLAEHELHKAMLLDPDEARELDVRAVQLHAKRETEVGLREVRKRLSTWPDAASLGSFDAARWTARRGLV